MLNHFILINDLSGKAALTQGEFVNGILMGITERYLGTFGPNLDHIHMRDNVRAANVNSGKGPQ